MAYIYENLGFNLLNEEPECVHDGCILCGQYKGKGYGFLSNHLFVHGGIKRICGDCSLKMDKEKQLIETTFHESGHAVALLAHGRKFDYVTNLRGQALKEKHFSGKSPTGDHIGDLFYFGSILGQVKGRSELTKNPDEISNKNFHAVKARLIIDFAGDAAVSILYGDAYKDSSHYKRLDKDQQTDYYEFQEIIKKHPEFEPYYERFVSFSVALLKSRWHQVVRIATALLEERSLNYDRCAELFNQK